MARNDLKIYNPEEAVFTTTPIVASGAATSINRGEPTKAGSAGAIAIMVDGDGTTSQRFTGIAKSDSSDTVAAAGSCSVYVPLPGLMYVGKAKTASLANTQALIDGLYGKRVVFDLTSTTWSIDTAAADSATNGVVIVGGNYQTSTLYFVVSISATVLE